MEDGNDVGSFEGAEVVGLWLGNTLGTVGCIDGVYVGLIVGLVDGLLEGVEVGIKEEGL